jgi:hypothetical protein
VAPFPSGSRGLRNFAWTFGIPSSPISFEHEYLPCKNPVGSVVLVHASGSDVHRVTSETPRVNLSQDPIRHVPGSLASRWQGVSLDFVGAHTSSASVALQSYMRTFLNMSLRLLATSSMFS